MDAGVAPEGNRGMDVPSIKKGEKGGESKYQAIRSSGRKHSLEGAGVFQDSRPPGCAIFEKKHAHYWFTTLHVFPS